MQFSPQSESIISGLLTGARLQSGNTVIGPLDAVTSAVLTVIAGGVDALSTQTGVERARNFLLSYQQIVKQQAEQKASGNVKPAPEHSTLREATMRPPNAWRLVEVRAMSYRGLAPMGEEIVFAFDGKCHLIYGPNGSGKSSLLGSIVWALTAQAMTDAEEQEVNADYFSPSQGGSRGKRLGQWPTHVTLPKADIKKVAPISRVILKLRSLEGSSEKWLSRSDSDGLALSDDGTTWKNCEDLGEIGISPLDLQLSLIAPMIFGRRPIERAEESRDILRLMLGFEDIATIGNLASDIGRNRTQLETAEKNNLQQLQDRITSTLSGLPNELAATHTLRASLVRLANDVGTLTEADIEEAERLIDKRVSAQEGAVAKAIGLDTVSNVHLDGIGEKLIRAVATLETGVAGSFPLFNALRATTILTATDADLSQQLARMNEALSLFVAEVTGRISKRYEWWRQETASNGRANLLLTAAQYYEPPTEQCPVCAQSISELPIKSELAELKGLPKELLSEARHFFRDLCDKLDTIVPPAVQLLSEPSPQRRLANDWENFGKKLDPLFATLAEKFGEPMDAIASGCKPLVEAATAILPENCEAAFAELSSNLGLRLNNARAALAALEWSIEYFSGVESQIGKHLFCDTDSQDASLMTILKVGKVAADDVIILKRLRTELKSALQNQKKVTAQRVTLNTLEKLKQPLNTVKLLTSYAEGEVSHIFTGIATQTVTNWRTLYPDLSSVLSPDTVVRGQKNIESLLAGGDFTVQAEFFANSGLQRAIALSFYFALLNKHPHGLGFIVMDDSILSLDAEHREIWSADLLRPLMSSMQVIFATHQKEFVQNTKQDFVGGNVIQLNPRLKGRAISWRPAGRLENAEMELRDGIGNPATSLRKYVEELLMSLDAYADASFFNQRNLTESRKRYAALKSPHPLAHGNQRVIAGILSQAEVTRVIDAGSHAATEAAVTDTMIRLCLDLLKKCDKSANAELERLERLRHPQRRARELKLNIVNFPEVPVASKWSEAVPLKALGRAAAKANDVIIAESDVALNVSLSPGSLVLVSSDSLEPIARRGQWVIVGDDADAIHEGDLVAVEGPTGQRYLRRAWDDNDFWRLQSINPVRPLAIESLPKASIGIRRIRGVLFEPLGAPTGSSGPQEWQLAEYPGLKDLRSLACVFVEGRSLDPIARRGQMVLVGASTPGGNAVFASGDLVVLETENQSVGNVIKRIFPVGEDLVLVSANPVEQNDPIVLKKAEVSRMWRVRGVLFETVTI